MRRKRFLFALLGTAFLALVRPEAGWTQTASPARDLAQAIRTTTLDPEQCYHVRDLALVREDIKLFFNEGYLIFSKPVAGERVAAVFAGVEEAGDGESILFPPRQSERISLAKFTGSPNLDEHFRTALLTFTDGSAQSLLNEINAGGRGRLAPDAAAVLSERWNPSIATLTSNVTQRIVSDLMAPTRAGGGFLFVALTGNKLGNFDVIYDPLGDDQVVVGKIANDRTGAAYDIWTGFPARNIRTGAAKPYEPAYALDDYRIQASLGQDLSLKAVTRATLKVGTQPARTLLLALSRAEHVTAARIDGAPVEVLAQDSQRGRAPRPDENDVFLLVAPERLAPGSIHQIEIEHEGSVIVDRGNNVYSVDARSNWYPRARMEFTQYDLEFHYPSDLTLVIPGEMMEDRTEGPMRVTRRRSGVPILVAGFNLGNYALSSVTTDAFKVDVYGNRSLDPSLAPRPQIAMFADPTARVGARGSGGRTGTTMMETPLAADPIARLTAVAADVSESLKYFTSLFGPPPLKTLTVSPIPGTTGQGFPGLIYLSTLSYLDEKQRPATARGERERLFFSDLMVAHEVAHQWWGNVVTVKSYQDDWLLEALANYSALLWLERKKGTPAMEAELAAFRGDLLTGSRDGGDMESFGPLSWGYRLESAHEPDTWRAITYEKGAWVLHMLRKRMGDDAFFRMLSELRRRSEFGVIGNQALQSLAAEMLPRPTSKAGQESAGDVMTRFFDNWIDSAGIPELRLHYSVSTTGTGRAASVQLTGNVEQNGVSDDFSVDVPVEIQFANGQRQTVWVQTNDSGGRFSVPLPQQPSKVSIPATSVLASIK